LRTSSSIHEVIKSARIECPRPKWMDFSGTMRELGSLL
jgi:hypothetical protein